MRINRAVATIAAVAIVSGCGVTHHGAVAVTHPAKNLTSSHKVISHKASSHRASAQLVSENRPAAVDPSLAWLESSGGQAQVTFNYDVDNLASALETEDHSPTVANHLVFEADARIVRAEARKILRTPALLPKVNRAGYERMLKDFIVVANLLQPGPGYGTTAQDTTAWYTALKASNITVS
jgi:hypothetical protein